MGFGVSFIVVDPSKRSDVAGRLGSDSEDRYL